MKNFLGVWECWWWRLTWFQATQFGHFFFSIGMWMDFWRPKVKRRLWWSNIFERGHLLVSMLADLLWLLRGWSLVRQFPRLEGLPESTFWFWDCYCHWYARREPIHLSLSVLHQSINQKSRYICWPTNTSAIFPCFSINDWEFSWLDVSQRRWMKITLSGAWWRLLAPCQLLFDRKYRGGLRFSKLIHVSAFCIYTVYVYYTPCFTMFKS